MRWIPILALALLMTSCSGEKEPNGPQEDGQAVGATAPQDNTFLMTPSATENPTNPVVSVDGEILTVGDLQMESGLRLGNLGGANLTPEMVAQMRSIVIDQYITRTLLLNQAKKQELSVSEADLDNEFAEIKKMIPPSVSIEDMLDQSPLGRDAMMDHIKNKILIGKLTTQLATEKVEISKEEVDEFIEKNKEELTLPERVEARHILLLFEPNDDDAAKAEKKKKLEGLRKEILDGADFAEVAKKHSQCGSAEAGGNLGTFDRSRMVPPFAEAAFSQKVGEIGDVVETQFGYHIIKVEKHEEEGMHPREDIEARIRDLKMQTVMKDYIAELRSKADIQMFNN